MLFTGELEHGRYTSDLDDVHPDILHRYYGTHGRPLARDRSGAGSRNAPIEPSEHRCPFNDEGVQVFRQMLDDPVLAETIPEGFGLRMDEWPESRYPAFHVWWPRAVRWARALKLFMTESPLIFLCILQHSF